jgi:hypothetical protein
LFELTRCAAFRLSALAIHAMDDKLTPPTAVEEVVQRFNSAEIPFSEFDVSRELGAARNTLKDPKPPSSPAPTISYWSCRRVMTRSSASAVPAFQADSVGASPSPGRW